MKLIEVVIRPLSLEKVRTALQAFGVDEIGIEEILISPIGDKDSKEERASFYRGVQYLPEFLTRLKVEIIAADALVDKIVEMIRSIAGTERKRDCRIFVLPLYTVL